MAAGFDFDGQVPITTIAQSLPIYMNNVNIVNARLTATVSTQDDDQIIFYLGVSATENGSYTWERVTNNVSHYFVAEGKWLKWRARFVGFKGNNDYFEDLKVYIE